MYRFFISFTKQELKIYELFGISLEVIFLSRVTIFFIEVTDLKVFFSRNPASGACIEGTCAKSACTRGICFRSTYSWGICSGGSCTWAISTKSTCIWSSCTMGAYTESVCIWNTWIAGPYIRGFWVGDAYTYAGGAFIEVCDICDTDIYIGSACVNNINTVKCFGIHSQSF